VDDYTRTSPWYAEQVPDYDKVREGLIRWLNARDERILEIICEQKPPKEAYIVGNELRLDNG
jgi:hypothetical protein